MIRTRTGQKRIVSVLLVSFFVFLALASSVIAQDIFDTVLGTYANFHVNEFYDDYYEFIDFVIYLVLFIGISQVVFKDRFKERAGKAVIIAMGIAFAIGMAVFETEYDFNIAMIGPLAMGIFLMLIGIFLYKMLVDTMGIPKSGAASMVFIVVYFFSKATIPQLYDWMSENMAIVSALLAILLPFAVVRAIMALWRIGWPKKEKTAAEEEYEEKKEEEEEKKKEKEEKKRGSPKGKEEKEADEEVKKAKKRIKIAIDLTKELKELIAQMVQYFRKLPDKIVMDKEHMGNIYKLGNAAIKKCDEKLQLETKINDSKTDMQQKLAQIAARASALYPTRGIRVTQRIGAIVTENGKLINENDTYINFVKQRIASLKADIHTLMYTEIFGKTAHECMILTVRLMTVVDELLSLEKHIEDNMTKLRTNLAAIDDAKITEVYKDQIKRDGLAAAKGFENQFKALEGRINGSINDDAKAYQYFQGNLPDFAARRTDFRECLNIVNRLTISLQRYGIAADAAFVAKNNAFIAARTHFMTLTPASLPANPAAARAAISDLFLKSRALITDARRLLS